jgi:hypothetical protein
VDFTPFKSGPYHISIHVSKTNIVAMPVFQRVIAGDINAEWSYVVGVYKKLPINQV